jgi:hypothetical protein
MCAGTQGLSDAQSGIDTVSLCDTSLCCGPAAVLFVCMCAVPAAVLTRDAACCSCAPTSCCLCFGALQQSDTCSSSTYGREPLTVTLRLSSLGQSGTICACQHTCVHPQASKALSLAGGGLLQHAAQACPGSPGEHMVCALDWECAGV